MAAFAKGKIRRWQRFAGPRSLGETIVELGADAGRGDRGAVADFWPAFSASAAAPILVPVFYECFRLVGVPLEVRMPLCIGTSLAIIIPTSIASFRAHYKRGAVDIGDPETVVDSRF